MLSVPDKHPNTIHNIQTKKSMITYSGLSYCMFICISPSGLVIATAASPTLHFPPLRLARYRNTLPCFHRGCGGGYYMYRTTALHCTSSPISNIMNTCYQFITSAFAAIARFAYKLSSSCSLSINFSTVSFSKCLAKNKFVSLRIGYAS